MHLRYLDVSPRGEALILGNPADWQVELFVLANDDDSYSLVALSGQAGSGAPEKTKLQGPYQMREQALAARSAIAALLLEGEHRILPEAVPHWRMAAQRAIRELRDLRLRYFTDCSFDPQDVYF